MSQQGSPGKLVVKRFEGEAVTLTVPPSTEPTTIRVILSEVAHRSCSARLAMVAPRVVKILRDELLPRAS